MYRDVKEYQKQRLEQGLHNLHVLTEAPEPSEQNCSQAGIPLIPGQSPELLPELSLYPFYHQIFIFTLIDIELELKLLFLM